MKQDDLKVQPAGSIDGERITLGHLLLSYRIPYKFSLGGVDITRAVEPEKSSIVRKALPSVEFFLDWRALEPDVPDMLADLTIDVAFLPPERIFTGQIIEASFVGDRARVKAASGVTLGETLLPRTVTYGLSPQEQFDFIARTAGLASEQFLIQGFGEPEAEAFEILVPLEGVRFSGRKIVGGISVVGKDAALAMAPRLAETSDTTRKILSDFSGYDTFILATVVAQRALEAERFALREAGLAAAWIGADARWTLPVTPTGQCVSFDRAQARALPRLGNLVLVRGVITGRGWIRDTDPVDANKLLDLDVYPRTGVPLPANLSDQDRQAVLSLHRAAGENDPLAATQALWECVEFLTSGIRVDPLFSSDELGKLKKLLADHGGTEEWSDVQSEKLRAAVESLNSVPLLAKFRELINAEDIPITEDDIQLLRGLRDARNAIVHGREAIAPRMQDVRCGIHIIARAIVHRSLVRLSGNPNNRQNVKVDSPGSTRGRN